MPPRRLADADVPRLPTLDERLADERLSRLVHAAHGDARRAEREARAVAGHELVMGGGTLTTAARLLSAIGQRMRGPARAGVLESARGLATAALKMYARAQSVSTDIAGHYIEGAGALVAQIAELAAAPEPVRKPAAPTVAEPTTRPAASNDMEEQRKNEATHG